MEIEDQLNKKLIYLFNEINFLKKEILKQRKTIDDLERQVKNLNYQNSLQNVRNRQIKKLSSRVSALNTTDTYI